MYPHSAEDVHTLFEQRFNAGDLDGLMALFEPRARLIAQPGTTVQGLDAIRDAMGGFLALRGRFSFSRRDLLPGDDLAILWSDWQLEGTAVDGAPVRLSGRTADVVRRQSDGRWLIALDNPWDVPKASS
ncbi:YybH family protein [Tahibacter amnicola]|uniref:Nuclear transport factor 2 family protein n=1 Tax=Tahibacter amnicola TaxID=2976241 RepID=A0ABY6BJ81_9GAMM|nr:nuclear transport factor 2 family protein [Tahibacter amnicola]UXI69448.1 nuclear transport factor 2 family protein [Tahibacter amnicola]